MIRMKSGVYGTKHELKRASDGPFTLPDEEEARLVKRGVAEYVFEDKPQVAPDGPSLPKYNIGMTEKQLRGIAAYYQVDASKAKKKQEIIDLLDAHFENSDDGDEENTDPADEDDGSDDPDAPNLNADMPTQ